MARRLKHTPIIGITCEAYTSKPGDFTAYELRCDHRYAGAVKDAGGHPVLLPIASQPHIVRRYLEGIDGLVIVGGEDIDPALYGAPRGKRTRLIYSKRTGFEAALYNAGKKRGLPIFGICYGMQLINVLEGGSLTQHLGPRGRTRVYHRRHRNPDAQHHVRVLPNTALHRVLGIDHALVATEHHQAVRRLAPGFKPSAVAPDGVIEAIEQEALPQVLAVQWHPERLRRSPVTRRLFKSFVRACAEYQSRRKPI